jgi:hypothetical protein
VSALVDADRMTALLTAIRAQPDRHWKSRRAAKVLRAAGHQPVSASTASHYLKQLAAAGHLIRHEQLGVRFYTLRKDDE